MTINNNRLLSSRTWDVPPPPKPEYKSIDVPPKKAPLPPAPDITDKERDRWLQKVIKAIGDDLREHAMIYLYGYATTHSFNESAKEGKNANGEIDNQQNAERYRYASHSFSIKGKHSIHIDYNPYKKKYDYSWEERAIRIEQGKYLGEGFFKEYKVPFWKTYSATFGTEEELLSAITKDTERIKKEMTKTASKLSKIFGGAILAVGLLYSCTADAAELDTQSPPLDNYEISIGMD